MKWWDQMPWSSFSDCWALSPLFHALLSLSSWQIDGGTMGTVTDSFLVSKITVDGNCSHVIKRCLFLWRKAMINLDSILKSKDITLPKKVHLVKAMVFPVVMYGKSNFPELDYKESWALKNWYFWTVVLEKTWESLGLQGDPTSQS